MVSEMQGVDFFDVNDDGEYVQVPISGSIKDMLNSKMVVLIADDAKKKIWLWKGNKASVRKKFIAARKSQDLRGQRGLTFKVDSIDHGSEPQDFITLIGGTVAEEVEVAPDLQEFVPAPAIPTATPPAPSIPSQSVSIPPPAAPPAPASAPRPQTVQAAPAAAPSDEITQQIQGLDVEASVKTILSRLQSYGSPGPDYKRELICIGPYVFSQIEQKKTFLGQEQITYAFELMESLPEGEFLAKGYIPRLLVNEGRILAIELFKSSTLEGTSEINSLKIKYLQK